MASADPTESALPAGRCTHCERDVLTHVEFAADGTAVRRCVHCDRPVPTTRTILPADLDALGYAVIEPRGCESGGGCGTGTCRTPRVN